MMNLELYSTNDYPNVINKTLTKVRDLTITFRQPLDEKQPVLIVHTNNLQDANYVYIPTFKRYYFITDSKNYNNVLSQITLTTDYLMTYQDTLLNSEVKITATEKPSYLATSLPTAAQNTVRKTLSTVTLPTTSSIILTTVGGVNNGE